MKNRKEYKKLWINLTPKTKHKTLCNSFEEGGLKKFDIIARLLSDKSYIKWRQIVNSIPKTWKKVLKEKKMKAQI